MNEKKTLEFKAIPLWEFIPLVIFQIFIGALLIIMIERELPFLLMQVGMIVIVISQLGFMEKRSKDLYIEISEIEKVTKITFSDKVVYSNIQNLTIVKYLFEMTLSCILIVDNNLLFILKKEAKRTGLDVITNKNKDKIEKVKEEIRNLIKISHDQFSEDSPYVIIPKIINIVYYSILIICILVLLFVLLACSTDNNHWVDYLNFF